MVYVCVAEDDVGQCRRVEWKRGTIALVPLAPPLDQTAVEQNPNAVGFNQMTGPSDLPSGTVKRDTHRAQLYTSAGPTRQGLVGACLGAVL